MYILILEHLDAPPQSMRENVSVIYDEFINDLEFNEKLMKNSYIDP